MDTYSYESKWEILPLDLPTHLGVDITRSRANGSAPHLEKEDAVENANQPNGLLPATIIDLRADSDFHASHVEHSTNLPLHSLSGGTESPWKDPRILKQQWEELDGILSHDNPSIFSKEDGKPQEARRVLLICYDGAVSRIAASILRAKGVEAFSLRGGYRGLGSEVTGQFTNGT